MRRLQQTVRFDRRAVLAPAAALFAGLLLGCGEAPKPDNPAPGKTASGASSKPTLRRVTLGLNWLAEMEHGGFYAALDHGYYEEAGFDVRIEQGGPNAPVGQQVVSGKFEFGIENADRILSLRAGGGNVVALMAPLQSSPRCVMVHEDSGITSFDELRDVTLAMSAGAPWAVFLKKTLNLDTKDVKVVPNPAGSLVQFLADKRFAQQGYVFSEPIEVAQQGGKARSLMVSELGFNPYSSVLIATDTLVAQDPEAVQKFVAATVKGWQKYLEDPAKTHETIHSVNPKMTLELLKAGDEAMRPLCLGDAKDLTGLGRMTPERWETLARQMVDVGAIDPGAVDPATAFTTKFLPEPPK